MNTANQETWRFLCALCHAPLSGPLIYLTDLSRLRLQLGDMHRDLHVVPAGFFANGEEAKTEMKKQTRDPRFVERNRCFVFPRRFDFRRNSVSSG